jgi:TrmH family RNA methyltransferase
LGRQTAIPLCFFKFAISYQRRGIAFTEKSAHPPNPYHLLTPISQKRYNGHMIHSQTNPKVKFVSRLQADRRFRQREQAFVIEGTRWLGELIQQAVPPQLVFYTRDWSKVAAHADMLRQLDDLMQHPAHLVSDDVMASMSDTITPAGILAVIPMQPKPVPANPSFLLILDGVSTPGNMGTILRTAAAAGVDAALLAPACVDAFNPKVVRGGMGVHARLPIHHQNWEQIQTAVTGMAVWLSVVDVGVAYTAVDWQRPSALIIGNEARGVSQEAQNLATGAVTIPMHHQSESLNAAVAAGVILFEAARQRG